VRGESEMERLDPAIIEWSIIICLVVPFLIGWIIAAVKIRRKK